MLSAEQTFFLSVLADHLNGRPTAPVSGLDWKSLYNMAELHQLTALFYTQCGAFLPPEIELLFLQYYGGTVILHAGWQKIAADIEREFTRNAIPYVIVKGSVIAACYPQPELRTMGDWDLVVKAEDKKKAHDVLLQLGFKNLRHAEIDWSYKKDSYEIELHHSLLYDEFANSRKSRIFMGRIWEYAKPVPGSSRCELDCSFHFLFLLTHLKKHIINSGAGFRQFMDLAVAVQKWQLDWKQIESWLSESGMHSFLHIALSLCKKWFQLPLPFAEENLPAETEQEIAQQIFRNGIFGYDDKANADNSIIAELSDKNSESLHSRLQVCRETLAVTSPKLRQLSFWHFWQVLFPDYDYMRNLKICRFLNGRPWLLPAGWIRRWLCGGKNKIQRIISVIRCNREKFRKRRQMLKKMGL